MRKPFSVIERQVLEAVARSFIIVLALLNAHLAWSTGLPKNVYIKTHSQSFSTEFEYALDDGKIWIKPNQLLSGKAGDWTLFQGTGVPFGKNAKTFGSEDKIVELSTEGLIVVARSSTDRLYIWNPTKINKPDGWFEKEGAPLEEKIVLPPHKDWAFSVSLTEAPWKRRTPMADINSYYEDAIGNQITFGFTATIFTVDPDGQRVRLWDTGLPASFHKAKASPERGRFVIERLSTAGSTLFVIDKSGKMYTTMYDYEMFGACPGLCYTFDPIKHDPVVGPEDVPLYSAIRVIPVPEWQEQTFDRDLLGDLGELTTNITIRITGKGNSSRELRIQGKDHDGRYGYFHRPILGSQWEFTATEDLANAPPAERAAFDNAVVRGPHELGFPQDKDYKGLLKQSRQAPIEVSLLNFNYFDTPTVLRMKLPSGKEIDLTLHTFDAWGPTVQQKEHPELVGTTLGEPKLLVGTLEIPKEILESTDPEIKDAIDTYFRRFHLVHRAFSVQADDEQVKMFTRKIQRNSTAYMDYRVRDSIALFFNRAASKDELIHRGIVPLNRLIESEELVYTGKDSNIDLLIERNKAAITNLRAIRRSEKWAHLKQGLVAGLGMMVFAPVNWFVSLTGITGSNPLWGNLSMGGSGLLKDYAAMNLKAVFTDRAGYGKAIRDLKIRVEQYENLRCASRLLP